MVTAGRRRAALLYTGRPFSKPRVALVWTRIILIAFLAVIVYNLGAGLYYMIRDKGETNRTLGALTRRIAISVALFVLLLLGFATGIIEPHGIGVPSANP